MKNIVDNKKCSGCSVCAMKCPKQSITMVENNEGFLEPIIDENKCIDCGLCKKICPVLNNKEIKKENFPIAYACFNKDENIRLESSSGGIFTLISNHVLEKNGVVFGAMFDKEFTVEHNYVTTKEELEKLRGSKYLQSKIGNSYQRAKEFLEEDKYVLFTGTPCQIEGLLAYLGKDYDKLYTQDIICHGVPSPKVWKQALANIKIENPIRINFRDKNESWNNYKIKISNKNESYEASHNDDLYFKLFLQDKILRNSCYNCSFKKASRNSDITLADFWGIKNVIEDFDDDKGTSLVIINSEKGNKLYEQIKNEIKYQEVDFNEAIKYNLSMISSVKRPKEREYIFKDLEDKGYEYISKKYTKISLIKKIKFKIKRIIKKILGIIL